MAGQQFQPGTWGYRVTMLVLGVVLTAVAAVIVAGCVRLVVMIWP